MPRTAERDYDRWLSSLSFQEIQARFVALGCDLILVKRLSNDNSKNQVYVGGELSEVALIPSGDVTPLVGSSNKRPGAGPIYQALVAFSWIAPSGVQPAPATKLIYYPQYPEVRLSGFLRGCVDAPRSLMVRELRGTESGRLLILGVAGDRVFGLVLPRDAQAHGAVLSHAIEPYGGVFSLWRPKATGHTDSRRDLLLALSAIYRAGWHPGQKMGNNGPTPYRAKNAGGYTLEALLGIKPNGIAAPDFAGWEVKSHGVGGNLDKPKCGPITLMTPEPDGGLYKAQGVIEFMLRYGYPSSTNPNRRDYAGTQRHGDALHPRCGTRLTVEGYDPHNRRFLEDGRIALLDGEERLAASWSFSKLLTHWKRKHAQTVYVPTASGPCPSGGYRYRFGGNVVLGEGTSFQHLLSAFVSRTVYYDPGTNIVRSASGVWKSHRRNQFRSKWSDVHGLYDEVVHVDLDQFA